MKTEIEIDNETDAEIDSIYLEDIGKDFIKYPAKTSIDKNHKLNSHTLKNSILIFPNAIGSSVGAYTIFSLKNNNTSPNGIICTNSVDITTASGCAISNIPLVFIEKKENEYLNKNRNGNMDIILDADNGFIILNTTNDKSI